jgi:5-methylcytosine-specific restriction endonuclease McrA
MLTKVCSCCHQEKNLSEFYSSKVNRDGYDGKCKSCKIAYQSSWRSNNRSKHREYSSNYYKEHKTHVQEYFKKWRLDNYEYKYEYDTSWRKNNPEKVQSQRRAYFAKRRALIAKEWRELKDKYSHTCLKCGRSEPSIKLTPDHVVPLSLGGSNGIDNIQPLCWGCNAAKQARYVDYRNDANTIPSFA